MIDLLHWGEEHQKTIILSFEKSVTVVCCHVFNKKRREVSPERQNAFEESYTLVNTKSVRKMLYLHNLALIRFSLIHL